MGQYRPFNVLTILCELVKGRQIIPKVTSACSSIESKIHNDNILHYFSPFMPNGLSHLYQLDEFISNFRFVEWYFSFVFKFLKKLLFANGGEPYQTPRFAASGLVLHCLLMSH